MVNIRHIRNYHRTVQHRENQLVDPQGSENQEIVLQLIHLPQILQLLCRNVESDLLRCLFSHQRLRYMFAEKYRSPDQAKFRIIPNPA